MKRDTILFDINETVLDLSSLKPGFEKAFGEAGVLPTWFAMLLQSSTVCAITGVKTGFATLAGIALDTLAARRGIRLSPGQRADLLNGFAGLKPHADIKPALTLLHEAGYQTVAFSNSSQGLIASQISNAGLDAYFDEIVSVEETGSFKPDGTVYQFVAGRLGKPIVELRLVATHDWDTHGAMTAGMQAAYIDRTGAPYNPLYRKPDVTADNMQDVANLIIEADRI